ncbi:MAG: hypothetical protein PHF63_01655 [Herbinix sp.]|nr:hypothetical protein [Herbinix sp.]
MWVINRLFNRKEQSKNLNNYIGKSTIINTEDNPEEKENIDIDKIDTGIDKEDIKYKSEDQETEETYEVLEREIHPTKIICPDCGGITLEGLEFCDKCGGELL